MKVSEKHEHFGLGYRRTSRHPAATGGKKFNSVRFSSAGYQFDPSVAIVDRENSIQRTIFSLVRKCPPGFKLDNWTSIVVPVVFSKEL